MMNILLSLLFLGMIICFLWVNFKLNREIKRNRILQSFISGIIRTISDYHSKTDSIHEDEVPDRVTQLPIPYHIVLVNIDWELSKDQYLENYEKWLKADRNIFFDDKRYNGDGFNFMYLDLFDKRLNQWTSNELMSSKKREWLSEKIVVTNQNIGELEGEIGMINDLRNGKLDDSMFTPENIDEKFSNMFPHLRSCKLKEVKETILNRKTK